MKRSTPHRRLVWGARSRRVEGSLDRIRSVAAFQLGVSVSGIRSVSGAHGGLATFRPSSSPWFCQFLAARAPVLPPGGIQRKHESYRARDSSDVVREVSRRDRGTEGRPCLDVAVYAIVHALSRLPASSRLYYSSISSSCDSSSSCRQLSLFARFLLRLPCAGTFSSDAFRCLTKDTRRASVSREWGCTCVSLSRMGGSPVAELCR